MTEGKRFDKYEHGLFMAGVHLRHDKNAEEKLDNLKRLHADWRVKSRSQDPDAGPAQSRLEAGLDSARGRSNGSR